MVFFYDCQLQKRCIQWKSQNKSSTCSSSEWFSIEMNETNTRTRNENNNNNKKWSGKSKRWFCKSSIILISCRAVARWYFWHEKSTLRRMLRHQTMTYYGWHKIIHIFFCFCRVVLILYIVSLVGEQMLYWLNYLYCVIKALKSKRSIPHARRINVALGGNRKIDVVVMFIAVFFCKSETKKTNKKYGKSFKRVECHASWHLDLDHHRFRLISKLFTKKNNK